MPITEGPPDGRLRPGHVLGVQRHIWVVVHWELRSVDCAIREPNSVTEQQVGSARDLLDNLLPDAVHRVAGLGLGKDRTYATSFAVPLTPLAAFAPDFAAFHLHNHHALSGSKSTKSPSP